MQSLLLMQKQIALRTVGGDRRVAKHLWCAEKAVRRPGTLRVPYHQAHTANPVLSALARSNTAAFNTTSPSSPSHYYPSHHDLQTLTSIHLVLGLVTIACSVQGHCPLSTVV